MILDKPSFEQDSIVTKKDFRIDGTPINAQHSPSDQVLDGYCQSSAENYHMPPAITEDQIPAMIGSACSAGTGKGLSSLQVEQVIKVADGALIFDKFPEFFAANSAPWLINEFQGRHALGIPLPDFESNKAACVAYFRALEFGCGSKYNDNSPLYLLCRRVIQIWLYLFFHEYVKELKKEEAAGSLTNRNGRQLTTVARDSILKDVYGNKYRQQQQYRNKHSEHERWGHRWWRIASCGGMGVVLLASKELAEKMYNISGFPGFPLIVCGR